jgi:hypothetical protein
MHVYKIPCYDGDNIMNSSFLCVQVNCYAQEVINLLTAQKSSWAISHIKVEFKANISKKFSVSTIRVKDQS